MQPANIISYVPPLCYCFTLTIVYSWLSDIKPFFRTNCFITYLLTLWSTVLLEKLASLQLVKKFPAFYGTRRFLTALTSARHLSLSRASPIQFSYPNPTSWRSILILSSHLRLGLPSGLFPSGFPLQHPVHSSPYPHTGRLVHLVGFIIRIYHDARPPEPQILRHFFQC